MLVHDLNASLNLFLAPESPAPVVHVHCRVDSPAAQDAGCPADGALSDSSTSSSSGDSASFFDLPKPQGPWAIKAHHAHIESHAASSQHSSICHGHAGGRQTARHAVDSSTSRSSRGCSGAPGGQAPVRAAAGSGGAQQHSRRLGRSAPAAHRPSAAPTAPCLAAVAAAAPFGACVPAPALKPRGTLHHSCTPTTRITSAIQTCALCLATLQPGRKCAAAQMGMQQTPARMGTGWQMYGPARRAAAPCPAAAGSTTCLQGTLRWCSSHSRRANCDASSARNRCLQQLASS